MKPQRFYKKLFLNKETIMNFTQEEMHVIKGAGTTPITACLVQSCPPTCGFPSCPGKDCPIPVVYDPPIENTYGCL